MFGWWFFFPHWLMSKICSKCPECERFFFPEISRKGSCMCKEIHFHTSGLVPGSSVDPPHLPVSQDLKASPHKELCCSFMFKDRCPVDCIDEPRLELSIFLLHLTIAIHLPHTTCISALHENRLASFSISWERGSRLLSLDLFSQEL